MLQNVTLIKLNQIWGSLKVKSVLFTAIVEIKPFLQGNGWLPFGELTFPKTRAMNRLAWLLLLVYN